MSKLQNGLVSESAIFNLAKIKVFSELDFIQTDVDKLAFHSELPTQKIIEIKQHLITKYHNACNNGLFFYELLKQIPLLTTGIKGLDELLEGGLRSNDIVEICGLSGSGKTQICLTICVNAAYLGKKIMFIDTKNDLAPSSLDLFLNQTTPNNEDRDEILERIEVTDVKDIYGFLSTLHSIKSSLERKEIWNNYDIIVVDSMSVLYLPFLGLPVGEGLGYLNHAVATLRSIVNQHNRIAIVTNLGTKYIDEEERKESKTNSDVQVKPLLGKFWSHVPNMRIIVQKTSANNSERSLHIVKSCLLPIGKRCMVRITDKGVV